MSYADKAKQIEQDAWMAALGSNPNLLSHTARGLRYLDLAEKADAEVEALRGVLQEIADTCYPIATGALPSSADALADGIGRLASCALKEREE